MFFLKKQTNKLGYLGRCDQAAAAPSRPGRGLHLTIVPAPPPPSRLRSPPPPSSQGHCCSAPRRTEKSLSGSFPGWENDIYPMRGFAKSGRQVFLSETRVPLGYDVCRLAAGLMNLSKKPPQRPWSLWSVTQRSPCPEANSRLFWAFLNLAAGRGGKGTSGAHHAS